MAQQSDSRPSDPDSKTGADAMTNLSGAVADKDAGADGAVPYGTRSRNRNGNARINYAEDKDIEMDNYDYYDKIQGEAPKKSSRLVTITTTAANGGETSGRVAAGGRKPLTGSAPGSDDSKTTTSHAHAATSSNGQASAGAAVSSSAAASRKRKTVNGSAAQVAAAATATATAGGQSARRVASANVAQSATTSAWPDTNMLSFENSKSRPQNGRLVADDGTVLEANDYVYLVCEPPGEPYYLGRIMEFLHQQNDPARPVDAVRINWFYRPKDIGRKVSDARLLIATMHSDISPLAALRGKCQIRHRVEIDDLDEYRKLPDCFWYEKLYDRYIQKHYDLIPTSHIINVRDKVKKVLDEHWKFVLVEQGRGKELTSAVKSCKRCKGYCPSNASVDCAVCSFTYHMNCVRPPLLKKPSRGFAWSCAACSRAQERKLENRHTVPDGEDDEDLLDEDEEDAHDPNTNRTTPDDDDDDDEKAPHRATPEQIYHASLWPYRYLGIHCKPEDVCDLDDRIYPRASTRLGNRNQASVIPWPGRPVEYVKPLEIKRGKGGTKLKDIQEDKAMREKRPLWILDEPPGYTARGQDYDSDDPDCTATPLWIPPERDDISTKDVIAYMDKARETAKSHGLPKQCTNLQDVAITDLYRQHYDSNKALAMLAKTPMPDFKEPRLTTAEEKRWEEAISKYGSELFLVKKHVKTMTPGQVVRRYYSWKKSDRGKQIWGNYSGRKGKKQGKKPVNKIADDLADDEDDSAFDTTKALEKKRAFFCLFCEATSSRFWRRAPGSMQGLLGGDGVVKPPPKDKTSQPVVALCRRCAELWRRYAIRWEDIDEVTKKVTQNGKTYKRKQDEELLKELQAAQEHGLMTPDRDSTPLSGTTSANGVEPPRKRLKVPIDRDFDPTNSDGGSVSGAALVKKKDKDTTNEATPVIELPQARTLPCAICNVMEPVGDQHIACRECRLTVHRNCYGVVDNRIQGKWLCDMCTNDKNPQVSIHYKCVLCPVEHTEHEFVEQPKLTHHKKKMSDKDRERERLEVQQARKAVEHYRKRQEELNRPVNPREPLKRTADNNWVHVTCAVWTPDVKFGNSKAMEPSEGIPSIPKPRYDEVCHACNQGGNGACIPCHHCRTTFHVECARQAGHLLAFDITPIKSSRRDQHNIVTINGESGTMSALLWCKDHIPTKIITHRMHDIVGDNGLTALQLYVQNFKQADLAFTGTVRKANLLSMAAKAGGAAFPATHRVSSTTAANVAPLPGVGGAANGEHANPATNAAEPGEKVCISCGVDVTLRWWPIDTNQERQLTNGHYGAIGSEAQKFVEQRKFQCHKCKKVAKSPRPHHTPAPLSTPALLSTPDSRPSFPTQAPPSMPSLRSPPPAPPLVPEYRDHRTVSQWPRPPSSHHNGPPTTLPHPVHAPIISQSHVTGARPSHPPSHAFSTPPSTRYEWFPPSLHHTSMNRSPPTSHLNGPPPVNGPPPPISALRPPPTSGPSPALGMGHRHSPSPMYPNTLAMSPHSLRGPPPPPPPPPSAFVPAYRGLTGHPSTHGPNSGSPLPPPRDTFAHGLHPQRSQYRSSVHVSPSGPPSGPPNGMPPHPAGDPMPARSDGRPSGASANPALRNLLH